MDGLSRLVQHLLREAQRAGAALSPREEDAALLKRLPNRCEAVRRAVKVPPRECRRGLYAV
jgi:hypothetical protein